MATKIKSVSFDPYILKVVNERAKKTGISFSKLINDLCRRHFVGDYNFFLEMEKQCRVNAEEYRLMRERVEDKNNGI